MYLDCLLDTLATASDKDVDQKTCCGAMMIRWLVAPWLAQHGLALAAFLLQATNKYKHSRAAMYELVKLWFVLYTTVAAEPFLFKTTRGNNINDDDTAPALLLEQMLQLLRLHGSDPCLVGLILEFLVAHCRASHSHVIAAAQWTKLIAPLLETLKQHVGAKNIQQLGQSLLATLAEQQESSSLGAMGRLQTMIDNDVLSVLMSVLEEHADNSCIVSNAAATLCWLVHAAAVVLTRAQTQLVIAVLRCQLHCASVFGNCICVLCGTTASALGLQDTHELIELVQSGMQFHVDCTQAQEACVRWIRRLDVRTTTARNVPDNVTVKFAPLIGDALRAHGHNDANLFAQACATLSVLAYASAAFCKECLRCGLVDQLLRTLQQQPHAQRVRQGAFLFLSLLLPAASNQHQQQCPFVCGSMQTLETIWSSLGADMALNVASDALLVEENPLD
jgi:hypothetical protein